MPIPLGILAAAGVRAAGGSYELIETITVSGSSTTSVTFSNLNTYASTYKHLQIRYVARTGETAVNREDVCFRFNGVSSNLYTEHSLSGNGSSVSSGATTSFNRGFAGSMPTNFDSSNIFGAAVMDILDPYATKNRVVRTFFGRPGSSPLGVALQSSMFISTDAITSLQLFTSSNKIFVAGSRFSIYGLKASA